MSVSADPVVPPRVLLMLAGGVWACSTAVIWIRLSPTPAAVLCGWRLLLSVALLSPLFLRAWKSADASARRAAWIQSALPGAALAAHFVTWTLGARLTGVANATLIVNMAPIAMPFMLWITQRERVRRREISGTAIAFLGIMLLFAPGFEQGDGSWRGELVCFGSMLLIALYFALGRKNRSVASFWLYLVPVYAWAATLCFIAAAFLNPGDLLPPVHAWHWLVLLAIIPTIVGHGLLNYVLRHAGGQAVSVASQAQFVFAAPMAWLLFGENPAATFYPAAALVLLGCWLATIGWKLPWRRVPVSGAVEPSA